MSVLLPSIAAELQLTYTQAAALLSASAVAIGAAQIPLAALSAGGAEVPLLGGGLVWFGMFSAGLGLVTSFALAMVCTAAAGIGGGAYHPIATNRVAQLSRAGGVGGAIGTLNFAGDVGKFLLPAAAGAMAAIAGWRMSLVVLGGLAAATGVAYLWSRRAATALERHRHISSRSRPIGQRNWWGIVRPGPFVLLSIMSILDSEIRSATLTFLPFLLTTHGFGKAPGPARRLGV
jgi:FSR family fosmidomycin resistance protein-like MFS transporter